MKTHSLWLLALAPILTILAAGCSGGSEEGVTSVSKTRLLQEIAVPVANTELTEFGWNLFLRVPSGTSGLASFTVAVTSSRQDAASVFDDYCRSVSVGPNRVDVGAGNRAVVWRVPTRI